MDLVTGANGLVGTHILFNLLKMGRDVKATKRKNTDLSYCKRVFKFYGDTDLSLFNKITWVNADVTDFVEIDKAVFECKHVYHCAAIVSFNPKLADKMYQTNVQGTANVVNACLDGYIDKLCFVSSIAAFGNSENDFITENTPFKKSKNTSHYAISKFNSECEVWRGQEEGLQTVIINPSVIVGPGNWNRSSNNMFKRVYNGFKYYTLGATGFVDVRDVARAAIELTHSDIQANGFILSSENLNYKEYFSMIAKKLNKKAAYKPVSKLTTNIVWRLSVIWSFISRKSTAISKDAAQAMHRKSKYSSEKIKTSIQFKFTSIDEAVDNAGNFYLQ